ncbi:unnamed protein product [Bursaphelenchus okinawaensis]|uniref:Sm protein B n=1 Tax=Bursaphelenchus okinawaensis TaxID=465554 RepID=A0A811JTZ5_9BILA|nr:unnamed protein product [Bursaphelenchus okinawaensis]CAG9082969.1 unnamed protein product [Bursaphelenchus okinawaensis]
MTIGKNNKMMAHLGYRMKVIVQDSRTFVGYFKAFDKHMNVILSDCEEVRKIKPKPGKKLVNEEEKRTLGLILLRGDKIISISVDGPAQKDDDSRVPKAGGTGGPGQARPANRTVPQVPAGAPIGMQGALGGHGVPNMQQPYGVPPMGQRPY